MIFLGLMTNSITCAVCLFVVLGSDGKWTVKKRGHAPLEVRRQLGTKEWPRLGWNSVMYSSKSKSSADGDPSPNGTGFLAPNKSASFRLHTAQATWLVRGRPRASVFRKKFYVCGSLQRKDENEEKKQWKKGEDEYKNGRKWGEGKRNSGREEERKRRQELGENERMGVSKHYPPPPSSFPHFRHIL